MNKRSLTHVFLDFDGTLFDNYQFQHFIVNVLSQMFDVDPVAYLDALCEYQIVDGIHALYLHKEHLLQQTGLEWSLFSGYISSMVQLDEKLHFCFPDTHRFIEDVHSSGKDVRLLTYGNEDYQRFKISLCPIIRNIPVHVVQEPKGEFLESYFNNRQTYGVLVDDKYPIPLPDNWQHAWIDRSNVSTAFDSKIIKLNGLQHRALTDTIASNEEANRK